MIQSVKGTKDILPDSISQWLYIENVFRSVSIKYGYSEIRTPIFEKTEVFSRSIGEATDIVNKEMYTFIDKGGDSITLRPEMTAALVRSVVQNSLLNNSPLLRLWYFGPYFRYERPQKGRFRQFHQYGAECLGSPYPESDAELILLANNLMMASGVKNFKILINSLGNDASRANYRKHLLDYLISKKDSLSSESRSRLETNPLRVLDSKDIKDVEITQNAPVILDYLDQESKEHFENVLSLIKNSGIEPVIQPRLVRGLDYYSHTVFEIQSSDLGAQDSLGGGGRYNELIKELGGKDTPAVGFALGVERMLLVLAENKAFPNFEDKPDVFIISTSIENYNFAQNLSQNIHNRGFRAENDLLRRSLKSQMREANRTGARYVIIAGDDEIARNSVLIKNMSNSEQFELSLEDVSNFDFSK